MFGWRIARDEGNNMVPTLVDGDYVLARRKIASLSDVVLIRRSSLGLIVKRISSFNDETQRYAVAGDNSLSTSSEVLRLVLVDSVIGVVYWRISPSGIFSLRNGTPQLQDCSE